MSLSKYMGNTGNIWNRRGNISDILEIDGTYGTSVGQGLGLMPFFGGDFVSISKTNICWRLDPKLLGDVKHWDIYQPLLMVSLNAG